MPYQLRPAEKSDLGRLQFFINTQSYLHRHLDWRDCLEWLGYPAFYLLEEEGRLLAALDCTPEPSTVAWLRLFGVSPSISPDKAFQILLSTAAQSLSQMTPKPTLVSLALRDWYEALLVRNGFKLHQEIVVFQYDQSPPDPLAVDECLTLRPMLPEDLASVTEVDHLSFEPIWQLSQDDLTHAYRRSAYTTVLEMGGEIVGYQMSSNNGFYAHLSRLAVHPKVQRRRLGYRLVQDLLYHFLHSPLCWGVTLNTQHDNHASVALYHAIGFQETGERFPVYICEY